MSEISAMEGPSEHDQNSFNCPICLDLLKDPVSIPCGHNYCKTCISDYWGHVQTGAYSCPQCRQAFSPRPDLNKNPLIAEMVEQVKLKANTPAVGPGVVECDYCTGTKQTAVKSCLVCMASYCRAHLQPHYESPTFRDHTLVQATKLQDQVCAQHRKPLEVFCHTDQVCICILCTMDEHNGHNTATAAASRAEKQKQLESTMSKFLQRLKDKDTNLQMLKKSVESYKSSAQSAVESSEVVFTELISFLLKEQSQVVEMIRAQERAVVGQVQVLLEGMEKEIADLQRRIGDIEELMQTHDHVHFLQSFRSLSAPTEAKDSPAITLSSHPTFEDIKKSLSDLIEQLQDFTQVTTERIDKEVKAVEILRQPEPKTREDFLQCEFQHQ
ncbi:hypothetical protein NFI96_029288 [Prochilodus magdalenae]|nr:hypothetical protein NFI96_029288 [Prochilodus magdalenae]